MTKWEYQTKRFWPSETESIDDYLNKYSKDGWEAVYIDLENVVTDCHWICIFKRAIEEISSEEREAVRQRLRAAGIPA